MYSFANTGHNGSSVVNEPTFNSRSINNWHLILLAGKMLLGSRSWQNLNS